MLSAGVFFIISSFYLFFGGGIGETDVHASRRDLPLLLDVLRSTYAFSFFLCQRGKVNSFPTKPRSFNLGFQSYSSPVTLYVFVLCATTFPLTLVYVISLSLVGGLTGLCADRLDWVMS